MNQNPIQEPIFVPRPGDAVGLIASAGWEHRYNTLILEREWRVAGQEWQRDSDFVQAQIRSDLRCIRSPWESDDGNISLVPIDGVSPRVLAMQSIWGEVCKTLDSYSAQGHNPLIPYMGYGDFASQSLHCDAKCKMDILPWVELIQRRESPASSQIWQPEIIIQPGQALMPKELDKYTGDLFTVIPLDLVASRRTMRIKHHRAGEKILVYTDKDGVKLAHPDDGLARAIILINEDPTLLVPAQVTESPNLTRERQISEWAGSLAAEINESQSTGKSINQFLVEFGVYEIIDEARLKTRAGVDKAMVGEVTFCLREWYGWTSKKEGVDRIVKWERPNV